MVVNGKISMPKPGSAVKYEHFRKQLNAIYTQTTRLLRKRYLVAHKITASRTLMLIRHTPAVGYGYKLVCCYDNKYSKHVTTFRGEIAVHNFMAKMLKDV